MTASARDAYVSDRFDRLEGRFKESLGVDDFRLSALLGALGPLRGLRVLDLGCGKGRFAARLREGGATVVGLDVSLAMLRSARRSGIACARGTARRLPFADGAFDAVVAVEVLEHVNDIDGVLQEFRRALAPSGRLAIIDKNAWSLNDRRPWLPNVLLKWLDERRGRWMYPSGGPVRERWFRPSGLSRSIGRYFSNVVASYPARPEEERLWLFRNAPGVRMFTLWTARVPGDGVE